jgi:methyl-accepting chemotaxis protein
MDQVRSATAEQSRGIEQIAQALLSLQSGTQHNAASAEESASASESLNAQASAMYQTVRKLGQVIGEVAEPAAV